MLGLGDIGPRAAMPVMEGKAMLFKEFAGIDAWPLCLDTTDTDEIIAIVKAIAPGFGGINLEDIAAPRCFEIEGRLRRELDIPVFHDDQHGTAVVVLAGPAERRQASSASGSRSMRVVLVGVGAAGVAVSKLLMEAGVRDIIGCDREGALHPGTKGLTAIKKWYARNTNPRKFDRDAPTRRWPAPTSSSACPAPARSRSTPCGRWPTTRSCSRWRIPSRRCRRRTSRAIVRVIATGRSDYPNQINNVLAFPGIFRGALQVAATGINEPMNLAAARAIAAVIAEDEVNEEYIIPSVFNKAVVESVAAAVAEAAVETGLAQRSVDPPTDPSAIYS